MRRRPCPRCPFQLRSCRRGHARVLAGLPSACPVIGGQEEHVRVAPEPGSPFGLFVEGSEGRSASWWGGTVTRRSAVEAAEAVDSSSCGLANSPGWRTRWSRRASSSCSLAFSRSSSATCLFRSRPAVRSRTRWVRRVFVVPAEATRSKPTTTPSAAAIASSRNSAAMATSYEVAAPGQAGRVAGSGSDRRAGQTGPRVPGDPPVAPGRADAMWVGPPSPAQPDSLGFGTSRARGRRP